MVFFVVDFLFQVCYNNTATQKLNIDTKRMFLIKVHSLFRYFFWCRFLCSNKRECIFCAFLLGRTFYFYKKLRRMKMNNEERLKNLGINIYYWRKKRGLTQKELAEKANVSSYVLSSFEKPDRRKILLHICPHSSSASLTLGTFPPGEGMGSP